MNVAIELPEDIAHQLEAKWGDVSQRALEALAIDAYRSGVITEAQVQRMLNVSSRWEVEAFLNRAQACLDYTEADLERDIVAIRNVTFHYRTLFTDSVPETYVQQAFRESH